MHTYLRTKMHVYLTLHIALTLLHRPFSSCLIMRSMSKAAFPVAFVRNSSSAFLSFAFNASSPALFTRPHLSHIPIRSATDRFVHLGMNSAATLVLPAPKISLK